MSRTERPSSAMNPLAALVATLERRAEEAEAIGATAPAAAVYRAVLAELRPLAPAGKGQGNGQPDRLLKAPEVASRLGISVRTVYQQADTWPFTKRVGRAVRFSERGLEAWTSRS